MSEIASGGLRISLHDGVLLGQHDGDECIIHVPSTGSYKVDAPTYAFLKSLLGSGDGEFLASAEVESRTDLLTSLRLLQVHGILDLVGDIPDQSVADSPDLPTEYSGELADLLVRREVPWLSWLLTTVARPLARAWHLTLVVGLTIILVLMLLGGAAWFDFEAAYAAWFSQPLAVMSLTILVTLLSGILHEAGHVAAARRHGVRNPVCGVGFYVHRPVFYVDVTAIDTHSRIDRAHVDLGGIAMDGLTLLVTAAVTATWFSKSGVALAVLLALAVSSLAPLNPVTKSDLNWCARDLFGARGLTASWGRPRLLLQTARVGADLRERRFARVMVVASLTAGVFLLVAGVRSVGAVGSVIRQASTNPTELLPVVVVWVLTLVGIMATLRAVRHRADQA